VSITKVVVFFTKNPTKLSLHFSEFSTIFYAFYKFQQFANTIGDTVLRWGPWKEMGARNVALGHGCRRLRLRCRPGKVGRRASESPLVDLRPKLGSRWPWWWRGAVAGGASRGCPTPGEARRPAGLHGVLWVPTGPSIGVGRSCGWGVSKNRSSPRRHPWRTMADRQRVAGSRAQGEGDDLLYRWITRLQVPSGPTGYLGTRATGRRRTDRRSKEWCATGEWGLSTRHAGTSRAASGRAVPREGTRPRPAHGPDANAVVRRAARTGGQGQRVPVRHVAV
jgi:hypothetical protein